MTKIEYQNLCKTNEKATDFTYNQIGTDEQGYPTYKIQYLNPPSNYKLIRLFEADKIAILEDLTPSA